MSLMPGPAAASPYDNFVDALSNDLELALNTCNGTATRYFRLKRAEGTKNSVIGLLGRAEADPRVDAVLSTHIQCTQDVAELLEQIYQVLNEKSCAAFVDAYQRYRLGVLEELEGISIRRGDNRQRWVRRWSRTVSSAVVSSQRLRPYACY